MEIRVGVGNFVKLLPTDPETDENGNYYYYCFLFSAIVTTLVMYNRLRENRED